MSYTKILKIIIEVYSTAEVDYPNRTVSVWLQDANVPYLQSKHLVLAMVTSLVLSYSIVIGVGVYSPPRTQSNLHICCDVGVTNWSLFVGSYVVGY